MLTIHVSVVLLKVCMTTKLIPTGIRPNRPHFDGFSSF